MIGDIFPTHHSGFNIILQGLQADKNIQLKIKRETNISRLRVYLDSGLNRKNFKITLIFFKWRVKWIKYLKMMRNLTGFGFDKNINVRTEKYDEYTQNLLMGLKVDNGEQRM